MSCALPSLKNQPAFVQRATGDTDLAAFQVSQCFGVAVTGNDQSPYGLGIRNERVVVTGSALTQNAASRVYNCLRVVPPWRAWSWSALASLARFLDATVVAAVVLGCIGFGKAMHERYTAHPQHFLQYSAPALFMLANSNGGAAVRVFATLGLWVGGHMAIKEVRAFATYALTRWGETIVEVQPP